MKRRTVLVAGCAMPLALAFTRAFATQREPVIGGPCEGCDWVFDGQPSKLASTSRIAPAGQPGSPMTLTGVVSNARGAPTPDIVVYAYHTDEGGLYPAAGNRHGTLRGWALTDAQGGYRFDSIRPGAYPSRNIAEHVHMHVIEPGVGTYYINNLEFLDDPLLTIRRDDGRAGSGLAMPARREGVWHVRRDIVLGRNIPGYPA